MHERARSVPEPVPLGLGGPAEIDAQEMFSWSRGTHVVCEGEKERLVARNAGATGVDRMPAELGGDARGAAYIVVDTAVRVRARARSRSRSRSRAHARAGAGAFACAGAVLKSLVMVS